MQEKTELDPIQFEVIRNTLLVCGVCRVRPKVRFSTSSRPGESQTRSPDNRRLRFDRTDIALQSRASG